jgi:hypothetical protein
VAVSNGVKYTMKRKDSYMVEVSRQDERGSLCKDFHAWPRANVFSNPLSELPRRTPDRLNLLEHINRLQGYSWAAISGLKSFCAVAEQHRLRLARTSLRTLQSASS